jgi:ketosteroid isomerase-like protein
VAGHCRVRGRSSGAESDPVCAWVIVVRDGRIISHRACANFDEALELGGAGRGSTPTDRPTAPM